VQGDPVDCPIREVASLTHGQVIEALIANRLTDPRAMVAVADWAQAVQEFGIDVSQIHWDMTSMSLHGAYDRIEEGYPAPDWGHPKDRRADLKQIQAGIAVTTDGGVPIFHRAYDGNAAEVCQVVDAMEHLRALAGPRTFLLIGDSKLISYTNVTAMLAAQVTFIARLGCSPVSIGALPPRWSTPLNGTRTLSGWIGRRTGWVRM